MKTQCEHGILGLASLMPPTERPEVDDTSSGFLGFAMRSTGITVTQDPLGALRPSHIGVAISKCYPVGPFMLPRWHREGAETEETT